MVGTLRPDAPSGATRLRPVLLVIFPSSTLFSLLLLLFSFISFLFPSSLSLSFFSFPFPSFPSFFPASLSFSLPLFPSFWRIFPFVSPQIVNDSAVLERTAAHKHPFTLLAKKASNSFLCSTHKTTNVTPIFPEGYTCMADYTPTTASCTLSQNDYLCRTWSKRMHENTIIISHLEYTYNTSILLQ